MNGFQAFTTYLAVKTHFTKKGYDFFKFKGQVTASYDHYQNRNDKYFFEKLAEFYPTKERLLGFLLSNILEDCNFYVGDFRSTFCEKKYQEWLGRIESLMYIFEQDLRKVEEESKKLDVSFRNIFKIQPGKITSRFLEMTLEGIVTLETYVIVDNILGLTDYYDGKILDPLYDEFSFTVKKYSPFIKLDRARFAKTFKSFI